MTFKDHFSGHAGTYRSARPGYPGALFDWLAQTAPECKLAWDCGCGNGQASVALAAHFQRVIGTDPSPQQIAQAQPHVRLEYRVEPAERSSLADASADLITVAQALHWFDLPRFFAEVRRVLKPGGLFAAWCYADCRVMPAIDALKDRVYVDLTGPYWPPERAHIEAGYADIEIPLTPLPAPSFEMITRWDVARFLGYLRSWSASQRYQHATGKDAVAQVEPEMLDAWGDPAQAREVRWQFHLRTGRHSG